MRFDLIVGVTGLACSSEAWCRPFADRSWHRAPEEAPEAILPDARGEYLVGQAQGYRPGLNIRRTGNGTATSSTAPSCHAESVNRTARSSVGACRSWPPPRYRRRRPQPHKGNDHRWAPCL